MDDGKRERQFAAWAEWREAAKAYGDELTRYIGTWFEGNTPTRPELPRTRESSQLLKDLKADAEAKQDAYDATL